jgi:hypothetical protein
MLNRRFTVANLTLLVIATLAGCDEFAKSIDENYEEREVAKKVFAELNEQCPKPINSYITLKSVDYLLGDVQYRYVVSESGRSEVYLSKAWKVKNLILQDLGDCPSADLIGKLGLEVHHVFQDYDGKQLVSFDVTKTDLKEISTESSDGLDVTTVSLPRDVDADRLQSELARLKSRPSAARARARFNALNSECPRKINDYTTLTHVKFIGKGRIEYRYEMTPAGLKHVNLDARKELQEATAREIKGTPIGDAIMALDWSAMHVYKSLKDTQMLSFSITRNELMSVGDASEEAVSSDADSHTKPKPSAPGPSAPESIESDAATAASGVEKAMPSKPKTNPFVQ